MKQSRSPASETATRWGIVAIALAAGLIAAGHVGKLPPALPAIRAELNIGIVTAGWLASVFSVTGMLIAIFLGAIADRLNHWLLAIAGLAVMAVGGFCGALTSTVAQLIVSRFFEGVGFLAVAVAAPSLIAQATSGHDRRMALGWWPAYLPGGVSAMIVVAPFVIHAGGWRTLWMAVAGLAAAGAITMALFAQKTYRQQPVHKTIGLARNFRIATLQPGPWLVAGCFALYGMQLYAVITWMPTFMIEERGLGAATAASLTAIVVVANGVFNAIGGWIMHRGATPWMMIAVSGAVMAIAAFGTFTAAVPDIARYISSLILCGVGGVVASAAYAIGPVFAHSPAQTGIINGILVQASNFAQFVGPTALAAGVSRSGRWESALWSVVGINVVLVVLALLVHRQEKLVAA